MSDELLNLITVPIFTGAIGYTTNWSGVWMLFNPVYFQGVRVPGLLKLSSSCRGRSSRSRASCTAASAGRGSSPRAPPRWARSRSTRGSRSSGARPSSTRSSSPTRSPSTSLRRPGRHVRHGRADHGARAPRAVARPAAPRAGAGSRPRPGAASGDRPRGDRRDRHPHRPDPGHQADGDPLLRREPRDGQPHLRGDRHKELKFITNFGFFFGFALGIPSRSSPTRSTSGGSSPCSGSSWATSRTSSRST